MGMTADCRIVNNTGGKIVFTTVSPVNDDAAFWVEPFPTAHIANGESCTITMSNHSVIFAPKGVGFHASFSDTNLDVGSIYLDDPAVGEHHFQFAGPFKFDHSNPTGNNYVVTIAKRAD